MKRTSTKSSTSTPNPFAPLCARLNSWRQSRSHGQRIPEDLWNAATELARTQGLSPTCTALKLNYYDLQRRLGHPRTRKPRCPSDPSAAFIQIPSPTTAPSTDSGTLELTHRLGARLTFRMPRAKARDLLLWMNAFLRS